MRGRSGGHLPRVRLGSWVWVPVLAAMAVGASVLLPGGGAGEGEQPSATTVPLEHRELVCPDVRSSWPDKTRGSVMVLSAETEGLEPGGTLRAGSERLRPLEARRGRPLALPPQVVAGARVVADGPSARALLAVRFDIGKTVSGALECLPPTADWWFSGGGASITRTSTLLLRNVDGGDASVHLTVFSPDGEVVPSTSTEILLPPGAEEKVELSLLAPFNDTLTVWVHADRGRVAASMLERVRGKALRQEGLAWIPGRAAPSRSTRLVADFSAARSSTVLVTNPGARGAIVSFEIAGKNGWFDSSALKGLTLGPGEVAEVDVTKALGRGASAVRVTADRPVVSVARIVSATDHSLVDPAVTFGTRTFAMVPGRGKAVLALLGGARDSAGTVVAYDGRGRVLVTKPFSLLAGGAARVPLPADTRLVEVAPTEGALSAALTVSSPGLAVLPLRGLVMTVHQPAIVAFSR